MLKKPSFIITIAWVVVSCVLTSLINEYYHNRTDKTRDSVSSASSPLTSDLNTNLFKRYQFINPNNKPEPKKESSSFNQLKTKLTKYIESLKKSGKITSASVYLRYYGHGSLMNVNPNETYSPGSMLKVLNLLVYLKLSEQDPGLLEKKIFYNTPSYPIRGQTYNSKQIEEGKEYTIKELLKYMIVHSDNKATYLLMRSLDNNVYLKMVNELNIPSQTRDSVLLMTAYQYSSIFKILYNSSYLNHENSEFALSLLSQSDFKIGLMNGLPSNITVAHKFGEAGINNQHELHESGLVYMDYGPYLITIMTRGDNINDLPPVLSTISKMVYDDISIIEE